jgi:hypothetical protein
MTQSSFGLGQRLGLHQLRVAIKKAREHLDSGDAGVLATIPVDPAVCPLDARPGDGNLEQAKKLAALRATDVEMTKFFGVSLRTFMRWKVSHPEFWHTLKGAKEVAGSSVRCISEQLVTVTLPRRCS